MCVITGDVDEKKFAQRLWGDVYFNNKTYVQHTLLVWVGYGLEKFISRAVVICIFKVDQILPCVNNVFP